jgi:hypothetical protein
MDSNRKTNLPITTAYNPKDLVLRIPYLDILNLEFDNKMQLRSWASMLDSCADHRIFIK